MKLLALDTATERASVALADGEDVFERELGSGQGHADHILGLIDSLLAEAGVALGGLDAIAFGRGPGAFTGVRLAASVTQGLAFAAGRPVVPVSDLLAVAQQYLGSHPQATRVLVCQDARMGEIYVGAAQRGRQGRAEPADTERVCAPEAVAPPASWAPGSWAAAGTGLRAFPMLAARLGVAAGPALLPHARDLLTLAAAEVEAGRVLPPAAALPVYLRDDVAQPRR